MYVPYNSPKQPAYQYGGAAPSSSTVSSGMNSPMSGGMMGGQMRSLPQLPSASAPRQPSYTSAYKPHGMGGGSSAQAASSAQQAMKPGDDGFSYSGWMDWMNSNGGFNTIGTGVAGTGADLYGTTGLRSGKATLSLGGPPEEAEERARKQYDFYRNGLQSMLDSPNYLTTHYNDDQAAGAKRFYQNILSMGYGDSY
jgi:hypothetical protein